MDTTQLTPRTRCLLPVRHDGELAGTFGDAAAFSRYPTAGNDHTYYDVIGRGRLNLSGSVSRAYCRKRTAAATEPATLVQARTLIACSRAMVTGLPAAEPG